MKKLLLMLSITAVLFISSVCFADIAPVSFSHLKYNNHSGSSENVRISELDNLPASYDLRDYGVVPSVRNQDWLGTCWMQGVIAAIETNYLIQLQDGTINALDSVGTVSLDVNLSVIHPSYYSKMTRSRQHSFSVVDSKTQKPVKFPSALEALKSGCNILSANAILSRGWGWGVVSETNNPELAYDRFLDVDELSRDILPDNPDAYTSVLRIIDAEFAFYGDDADIMFTENNRCFLKDLIMKKGALAVSYSAASDDYFLNKQTGAYFYSVDDKSPDSTDTPADETNHVVAIIGWDDNYPVENFNSQDVTMPSKPGAWLVRNSWGDKWPNDELGGYFWISYEQCLYYGTAFTVEPADKYLHSYYYDELGWEGSWGNDSVTAKAANVFRARTDGESLEEVSFYTTDNGANITISIYTGYKSGDIEGNIESGSLVHTQSQKYELAGYHTMKLINPVSLNSGEYFAVVLEAENPEYKFPIAVEQRINGESDFALAFDGESWFMKNNQWLNGAAMTIISDDKTLNVPVNACIKAFTRSTKPAALNLESPLGKKIASIQVGTNPELTVKSTNYQYDDPKELSGRVIKQTVTDNDGEILPEGTIISLNLIYVEEFNETTPSKVSKYGLRDVPYDLDPMYPSGFTPDMYSYEPDDGYIYPVYLAVTSVDRTGKITIKADGMEPLSSDKKVVKLPEGHYDIIYSAFSSDSQPLGIVGALRTIEITSQDTDYTPDNDDNDDDNNDNSDGDSWSGFLRRSSGGCDSGFGLLGLGLLCLILRRKV